VFEANPYPLAVNGSLWTMPWEIRMYVSLAGLALLWRFVAFPVRRAVLWIAALALLARATCAWLAPSLPEPVLAALRFVSIFYLGAAFHVLRDRIALRTPIFLLLAAGLAASATFAPALFRSLYVLALPYVVLFLAYVPAGLVRAYNRVGDYSYGTYIYAFPIQQSISATLDAPGPLEMLAFALPLTLLVAAASWHFVEKPALAWKRG
jgi:peptidoglycan/LPS O-acetylase OafA/YrhL